MAFKKLEYDPDCKDFKPHKYSNPTWPRHNECVDRINFESGGIFNDHSCTGITKVNTWKWGDAVGSPERRLKQWEKKQ